MHFSPRAHLVMTLGTALLAAGCQTGSHTRTSCPKPVALPNESDTRPVVTVVTNFPDERAADPKAIEPRPAEPARPARPAVPVLAASVVAPAQPAVVSVPVAAVVVPAVAAAPAAEAATHAPAVRAEPVRPVLYVVREGDTLSEIAEKYLDGASHWPEIVAANPGLVPEKLRVGRTIHLPQPGEAVKAVETSKSAEAAKPVEPAAK